MLPALPLTRGFATYEGERFYVVMYGPVAPHKWPNHSVLIIWLD